MKKEFLDLLAEKLNTGSMRNIYLNALPSRYKARMDFFDIDKLKNGFCTNDKLFSIEDEWESIDSFYLSFYNHLPQSYKTQLPMTILSGPVYFAYGRFVKADIFILDLSRTKSSSLL